MSPPAGAVFRERSAFPGKIAFNFRKNLEVYFWNKRRIQKPESGI
jgi:hypothetical protein